MTIPPTNPQIAILEVAREIENHVNKVLARILDVDLDTSITLGNSEEALTFPTKVFMLIDLLSMSAKKRAMFEHFLALWKHITPYEQPSSFTELYSVIPGGDKYILKSFPQEAHLPVEEQLSSAVNLLGFKLKEESTRALDILRNRHRAEILATALDEVQEAATSALQEEFTKRYTELDERTELGIANMPVKDVRTMLSVVLLNVKGRLREFVDSAINAERYPTSE